MNDTAISAAIDYYIDVLEKSATTSAYPPFVQYAGGQFGDSFVGNLYALEEHRLGRLCKIKFFCTQKKAPEAKCFGSITFKDYKTLEEEIEIAVNEYRRNSFKRTSRKQRHAKGE